MTIGNRLRFEILKRDSFTCGYCGRSAPEVKLQVDHIHPRAEGGSDDAENLLTACFECNHGKIDRLLEVRTLGGSVPGYIASLRREIQALREKMEASPAGGCQRVRSSFCKVSTQS